MEIFSAYLIVFAAISGAVLAGDPSPTQDFCVADLTSKVKVNGFACKDPATVTADDFYTQSLAKAVVPNNTLGLATSFAFVPQIPGINTLGVSLVRFDFAPYGLIAPHHHLRASELIFVVEGIIEASFITTGNVVFTQTVKKGGVFAFPVGLVHFLKNTCDTPALVIGAFNSQSPGTQLWATTLFGAQPPVSDDLLATTFQITSGEVEKIRSGLFPK